MDIWRMRSTPRRIADVHPSVVDSLLFSVLGWLVVAPWTGRGFLLLLDWSSGPTTTLTNSAYGLDSDQADAMPVRLAMALLRHLAGPGVAAWLPILLFFPIAGLGMCRLVGGGRTRRLAAGLAFTVNPFVFERLRAGHVLVLLGMALLPWLVASAQQARREQRWFRVRTAALFAGAIAVAPHMWWIGLVALTATAVASRPTKVDLVRLVATAAAAVTTTAYALVLQVVGVRTVHVGHADLDAFATRGHGLGAWLQTATLHGFWRGGATPADQLGLWWPLVAALAIAVAALGVAHCRRELPAIAAAVGAMSLAGIVLGAGSAGPTGFIYRLAFDHLPMFAVMREAQKFTMLVTLGWAFAFGFGAEAIVAQLRAGSQSATGRRLAPFVLLFPLLTAPSLLWGLGGEVGLSHYPTSWARADTVMGNGDEAVLMLPWHQYQSYDFTAGRTVRTPGAALFRRPVITSDAVELPGLRTESLSPRSAYLDRIIARGASITHLGRFLAPLDVRFVVVTLTADAPGGDSWLSRQVDLREVLRSDDLVVYENLAHGAGRVAGRRTVRSFDEYVQLVEADRIGHEAVFLDPTAAADDTAPLLDPELSGLHRVSPVRFQVDAGSDGLVVVPAPSAVGWRAGGDTARATVQGVMAFEVGENTTAITYGPWAQVRRGYLVSALALLALFGIGLAEHRHDLSALGITRRAAARCRALWRRFRAGTGPAYLAVWLVATVAVNRWFNAGSFVATGDMGPFIRRGWTPGVGWSWTHAITGGGSAGYVVARWYEFGLVRIVHAVGGTDTLAQRFLYMTIYPMVALGVASVAATFTRNRLAIAAAGSFAVLNGFFLTRLPNPLNVISVGCVAMVAAVGFRVAKGERMPAPALGLAMLFMSFLAYNPPMLTVALAWTGLGVPVLVLMMYGRSALWKVLRYACVAAPWALAINLFWLVPFAQAFTGGGGASATAQTDPTAWAWSQAQNNVPNVLTLSANWAWYKPQYLPFTNTLDQPWWIWLRYLLPVLVVVAPLLALPQRRRKAFTLVTLVLLFTILAKGLQPPFSGLNLWLYGHIPGFWLFREPMSKLGQLLVLFDALLIALAVEGIVVRTAHLRGHLRTAARLPVGFATCAVLAWPFPLATGAVIPDVRPLQPPAHVQVPSYWRSTASFIDSDTADGKVLVLPLDDYYQMPTTWGFSGVDSIAGLLLKHPVLQRHPDGYFGDTPGLAAQVDGVERALGSGDLAAVQPLLSNLGVRWIVLRHDLVVGNPARTFLDPATLRAPLSRVASLQLVQRGTLDVYQVIDGASDTVRTTGAPLQVPGEPDAMADAVASLPVGQSLVGTDTDYTITADETAADENARSAADGVWWPVPAVAGGAPTTTFTSTGGTFTVNQRSRAQVAMVPTEVAVNGNGSGNGSALQLSDPTTVEIDGRIVSSRPAATYPISAPDVAVVRAGDHTVSLDHWTAASMAAGSNAADGISTVPVGAGTELTAWSPSTVQPSLSSSTSVYDCNNYEPRQQSELQLQATTLAENGHTVTRLSAADHAACVSQTITGVAAGDTVRLRLEYRTEEGKRPQVCLLEVYADGSDRCVFDARMRNIGDWTRYELVHTIAADVVEVRVVLYANVGLRLSPRTTSDYRDITVTQLDEVLHTTAWPREATVETVTLTAGAHTMTVRGGAYGSQLTPFEQLQDCFRYDDATTAEAGLAATVTTDDGEQPVDGVSSFEPGDTIEMRAKDHMACIASTMPDYGGNGLYRLEYGYHSVALRKPRVAVYHRGPNVSEPLPANGAGAEWTTYRADLQPTMASVETRLYLYAPRDLAGQQQAVVQYRDVAITPMASSSSITLLRVQPTTAVAAVDSWTRPTPASFSATVTPSGTMTLVVAETYAPGWTTGALPAGVTATKVRLNGWQNAWVLHTANGGPVTVRLLYAPAFLARTALKISALAFLVLPFWLLFARRVRARLARPLRSLCRRLPRMRRGSLSRLPLVACRSRRNS